MYRLIIGLRTIEREHKGKHYKFGELRINDMARDCADALEELLAERAQLHAEIKQIKAERDKVATHLIGVMCCLINNCGYLTPRDGKDICGSGYNGGICDGCESIWRRKEE